jgi:hypothetical protein
VDYIVRKLDEAATRLSDLPEASLARQVADDARTKRDVIEIRIDDLLQNLARDQGAKDRWE